MSKPVAAIVIAILSFSSNSLMKTMDKSDVFSILGGEFRVQISLTERKRKKYSLSCLVQREIYSVEAGTERREGGEGFLMD